jgi:cell division transport system permease protein
LFRAAGYGLISGAVAAAVLYGLSDYAQSEVTDLSLLHNQDQFLVLICIMLVLGILVAVVSTYFSIQKYLKMSLDQLY